MEIKKLIEKVVIIEDKNEIHKLAAASDRLRTRDFSSLAFYERFYKSLKKYLSSVKPPNNWLVLFVDEYLKDFNGEKRAINLKNKTNKELFTELEKDFENNYKQKVELLIRLANVYITYEKYVANYVLGNWNEGIFWSYAKEVLLKEDKKI